MHFPVGIFFAFFNTNINIYILNNIFCSVANRLEIQHLEVQSLDEAFVDEV